jgi:ketosteroid isomerase-like protein
MNIGPIEDRLAIRELIEAFTVGAMTLDAALWSGLWVEDGTLKFPSMSAPVKGRDAIAAQFLKITDYVKFLGVATTPFEQVVDGDRARGKVYLLEHVIRKRGGQKIFTACFTDEYVRKDGRWYFQSRSMEMLGVEGPPDNA